MEYLIKKLSNLVQEEFEKCGYDREYGRVNASNRPDLCQFQCNGALAAAKKYRKPPINIAKMGTVNNFSQRWGRLTTFS